PTEPCPLSLHDALPISSTRRATFRSSCGKSKSAAATFRWKSLRLHPSYENGDMIDKIPTFVYVISAALSLATLGYVISAALVARSEEHTSELQSRENLV